MTSRWHSQRRDRSVALKNRTRSRFTQGRAPTLISKGSKMNTYHVAAIALFTGTLLGGIAVERIQAQVAPLAYTIAEVEVTDEGGYKTYMAGTSKAVPEAGGQF